MQKLQLFIEGERIDLFKDETVSLTQSIQNVKDISKIFTSFSKTFSVPASKTNNKIFKHYYNYDIVGGFDARKKKAANIELNNLAFTDGKIKLEGVDLKDNKPHTYRITFFGNTVELKDLLGEDKLSALTSLTSFNESYDSTSIKAGLQLDPTLATSDVIVPLITHTDRLIYDSTASDVKVGNVAYEFGNIRGVDFSELKYALRLQTIIEAIETQYSITFSNDFFVSTNTPFYNLFMWLHRKKGDVKNVGDTSQTIMSGFTAVPADDATKTHLKSTTTLEFYGGYQYYTSNTNLVFTTASANPYNVSLYRNGIEESVHNNIVGNFTINSFTFSGDYTIYIEASTNITFTNIQWFIEFNRGTFGTPILENITYSSSTYNYISEFVFDITQQIPEMKVIDFLSGIFRMFNLTAYFEDNVIIVKTLDSFYSGGSDYDITKYIDTDKSSVNLALPFREINFQHDDTKTFLAAQHKQRFAKTWGLSYYKANTTELDGSIYSVKTPFAQLKYERLVNLNNGLNTTVQFGYFVDDNQDSYYGKPLIFYPIRQTSSNAISFVESPSTHSSLTTYNIPSNSVALDPLTNSYNMNFFNEVNEYELSNDFTNTLFEAYYSNYITSVFNEQNRLTKITAYLPLRILLNYTLADRFLIAGNSYKINSINTNLNTGKSEMELLNDL